MYRFWAFSVKHATQQKFESLRATFLPKSHNMVNSNSDFIQSMLNSLQNGGCLFIITTLLVHTINATISSKNQFFYFSQFSPCTLTCSPNHLYNPRSHSLPLYFNNFSPPSFCVQTSQQCTPKIFSLPQPFCQFRPDQGTSGFGGLLRTDTVLISPFFKIWTVKTGLTITDSLSLSL